MTLFGTTFDTQAIVSLIGLLTLLVFWLVVLKRERNYLTWFRQWEADRKARYDAEKAARNGDDRPHGGPWG